MITLQKNAISIIFEDIFCYFSITHDALRPHPFAQNIFHLHSSQAIFKQKFQFKVTNIFTTKKTHVNCKKVKEMPTFAHVHSMELEIFADSFPLIARHYKYNVQFLEALLPPFHQVYMSDQSCFP